MDEPSLFEEPPLSTRETAKVVEVSTETINRWVREGIAKPLTQINRAWVFSRSEVERLKRHKAEFYGKHNRPTPKPKAVA